MNKIQIDMTDSPSLLQYEYEDGYGIATLPRMEGKYLVNINSRTAIRIPEEFQQTPIYLDPFCGGYTQGLIMVSLLGDVELQYHHTACGGIWGWIDTELNIVISPQYIYAENFVEGKAKVCKGHWDIKRSKQGNKYWCTSEQWGVIDLHGKELISCQYDELFFIENTDRYFLAHKGGWEKGNYCIFDIDAQTEILQLDFEFDPSYMFNEYLFTDNGLLCFFSHLPGEGKDLVYVYSVAEHKYLAYQEEFTERTLNGKKIVVIHKDGTDITVF